MNQQIVDTLLGRYNLPSIRTPDPANPEGAERVMLTRAELVNRLNGAGGALTLIESGLSLIVMA